MPSRTGSAPGGWPNTGCSAPRTRPRPSPSTWTPWCARISRPGRQLLGEGKNSEDGAAESGAPLWRNRSRHRTAEVLAVPLSDAHGAAKKLGGSINDFFVTGAVAAAIAYHDRRGVPIHSLNLS